MLALGVGAALPLLALGLLSRAALQCRRSQLLSAGRGLKFGLGPLLVVIGAPRLVQALRGVLLKPRCKIGQPLWRGIDQHGFDHSLPHCAEDLLMAHRRRVWPS